MGEGEAKSEYLWAKSGGGDRMVRGGRVILVFGGVRGGGGGEDGREWVQGGYLFFGVFLGGLWGDARLMVLVAMVLLQWLLSLYIVVRIPSEWACWR